MSKIFYDHLIVIEEVVEILSKHKISKKEQQEILDLIDQTMHQEILSTILTHLPKNHHEAFLIRFHATPNDKKILEFLQENTSINIEKELLKTANLVKKNVVKMIQSSAS